MSKMDIYEAVREVPKEAQKTIGVGRLKGMTDINPMWRIKQLTELFGPCGIGWKYTVDKQWMERGDKEIAAFCNITLYIKDNEEWSEGIPGTGGSKFVSSEKNGLYTSDECYKMALTDAISVACKALGFGADVYWEKDATKYGTLDSAMPYIPAPNVYNTTPEYEAERANYLKAIAASGIDARVIDRSCYKKYGKMLTQLNNDQLAEVAVLLANREADNAGA